MKGVGVGVGSLFEASIRTGCSEVPLMSPFCVKHCSQVVKDPLAGTEQYMPGCSTGKDLSHWVF